MDSLSVLSPVKRVVFIKPSRIGGSEAGNNWIGYVIDNAPGPFMLVSPREGSAKSYVDQKIEPMIQTTPRVRDRIRPGRGPQSRFSKVFDACVFTVANAKSAASLRALDARFLMCDEVDAYPPDVDGEGDPLDIALMRTANFGERAKQYIVSTPLVKGTSRVEHYFLQGDRREYRVPCPHCGHMQALVWDQLRWPKDQPEKAAYECVECQRDIHDHYKAEILGRGEWVPTAEGDGQTRSYRLNSLYTPSGWSPSFAEMARDWIKAQNSTTRLKVFVNQRLGETWEERGEAPEWERLYERREDFPLGQLPDQAAFLTAGVDVQKDRIEIFVWAWGPGKESWLIEHRIFGGDPYNPATFEPLTEMLAEEWTGSRNRSLPLARLAIDSNYATDAVIAWARDRADSRILVIRGDHWKNWDVLIGTPTMSDRIIDGRPTGVRLWPVGGALIKQETYSFLKLAMPMDGDDYPPGFIHLPKVDAEVVQQLCAEDLVIRHDRNGFPVQSWVKNRDRNEALDCRVYARAAAEQLGLSRLREEDWDDLLKGPQEKKRAEPKPRPSSWLDTRRSFW